MPNFNETLTFEKQKNIYAAGKNYNHTEHKTKDPLDNTWNKGTIKILLRKDKK